MHDAGAEATSHTHGFHPKTNVRLQAHVARKLESIRPDAHHAVGAGESDTPCTLDCHPRSPWHWHAADRVRFADGTHGWCAPEPALRQAAPRPRALCFLILRACHAVCAGLLVRPCCGIPAFHESPLKRVSSALFRYIPFKRLGNGPISGAKPAVIIGNHASYVEILYVIAHYDVTFVSKIENASLPVIGSAIKALQCILVDRQNGKAEAADAIRARTHPDNAPLYPTLCLFPEVRLLHALFFCCCGGSAGACIGVHCGVLRGVAVLNCPRAGHHHNWALHHPLQARRVPVWPTSAAAAVQAHVRAQPWL